MEEPTIRLYRNGDEKQIFNLLKTVFPAWKTKTLDHWMWKYISPPIESDIIVAEKDSKIIGIGHRINVSCKIGERTEVCTYGDDWGVNPEHRRKGINTKILELLDKQRKNKNITTMYTQTRNPIVMKLSLKRGRLPFPRARAQ
jgi:N-acetylglutamate synthase-like GNAT family acetyltransferase